MATVVATSQTHLKCLVLGRQDFVKILGPLSDLMAREKSEGTITKRMAELSGELKHKRVSVILKRTTDHMGTVQSVCKGSAEEMLLLAKQKTGGTVVSIVRSQ
eukprot:1080509-Pyramimonas_sp.AAC.1